MLTYIGDFIRFLVMDDSKNWKAIYHREHLSTFL